MRFVIKALFFLAVVAAFIPRQPGAEAASGPAVRLDLAGDAAVCAQHPALCGVAQESAVAARLIAEVALDHAGRALLEKAPADAPDAPPAADDAEAGDAAAS